MEQALFRVVSALRYRLERHGDVLDGSEAEHCGSERRALHPRVVVPARGHNTRLTLGLDTISFVWSNEGARMPFDWLKRIALVLLYPSPAMSSSIVAVIAIFFPLTGINTCIVGLVYLYLRHEHHFDASLARRTPLNPNAHLPLSREEWLAHGGLKSLSGPAVNTGDGGQDCCIVCRDIPSSPMQISRCGHIFCEECLTAWQTREGGQPS